MINFGAGPARLPEEVVYGLRSALLNVENSGWSLTELPHRSTVFKNILREANSLVKRLLHVPDNYEVLWIQGGGRMQFAMLPMNFRHSGKAAAYLESGYWAKDAMAHATYYLPTVSLGSSESSNFSYIPDLVIPDHQPLVYAHITSNNTIYGTQMTTFPHLDIPLVADMSSDIFSRPVDVSKFKMIYAVAQKNIGIAGVTMVIIDREFARQADMHLPEILSYEAYIRNESLINTAPVTAIYSCLLSLRHMQHKGMDSIYESNISKSTLLYDYLDNCAAIRLLAQKDRSHMNVCFTFKEPHHNQDFIDFALQHNITGIEGHRRVGGLRISLYNGISFTDVQTLITILDSYIVQYL